MRHSPAGAVAGSNEYSPVDTTTVDSRNCRNLNINYEVLANLCANAMPSPFY